MRLLYFDFAEALAFPMTNMRHLLRSTIIGYALVIFSFTHAQSSHAQTTEARIDHLVQSALGVKAGGLTGLFEGYAIQHNDQLPTSWEELDRNYSFSHLDTYGSSSIPDNFYLVPNAPVSRTINNVQIPNPQIIAIGRQPLSEPEQEGLGRFVIYRLKDGSFEDAWYAEEKIQQIIAETHIVVPPPPAIPPVNPYDNPTAPATATSPAQTGGTSPLQANPSQPSSTTPAPLASASQAPPTSETGIPWWIYAIVVLSMGSIGALLYFLRAKK